MPDSATTPAPTRKISLTTKVAIIGGGAAGLSAAKLLNEAGVSDVTVFEAQPSPGGKALSVVEEGGLHELGTCYSTWDHRATNRWMGEVGIRQVSLGRQRFDGAPFLDYVRAGPGRSLPSEMERYIALWLQHRWRAERGFDDAGFVRECALPMDAWLARHGFVRLRRFMLRALTTMGYGTLEEIPAVQALRWCTPGLIASGLFGGVRMPVQGWWAFWQRLCRRLNLRAGEPVTHVERGRSGGLLRTPRTECRFEQLLVTLPLDDFARTSPLSKAEQEIAASILWGSYVTTLVRVKDWFTAYETDAFSSAVQRDAPKGSVLAARRPPPKLRARVPSANGELYVCGQYGGIEEADLARRLRQDIEERGGRIAEILRRQAWRYFPRYRRGAIENGLLATMARIQGENSTWYSGASFSHEAVSSITAHNERLVRRIAARVG